MNTEQEDFWNADNFVVITDRTKPAMKWTINALRSRGKTVSVVDLSDKPDPGALNDVSDILADIPANVQVAVVGITKTDPSDVIKSLEGRGIGQIWMHWMTDTPKSRQACEMSGVGCITGRCPMMYLGGDLSIHGIHRGIAKLTGKY